jgi:predicted esterase
MRFAMLVVVLLLLLRAEGAALAEDWPYPSGRSSHSLHGLAVELDLPQTLSREKPASLVVILHGNGGSATGMAGALRGWAAEGYVVCAPKSTDIGWSASDVKAVLQIVDTVKAKLPIDPKKVHVVGFSNGGWNLPTLAFHDELRPCSAAWVASGCTAGPPKWAKKDLGVIAMAGTEDSAARSSRETVKMLTGKVRSIEARFQPGLGHKWPRELMPYFQWWMGAMEGRFVPGVDMNFDWGESIEEAVASLAGVKRGGVLVYAFQESDAQSAKAKSLQNVLLMDPLVRHYGNQLKAVKLDYAKHREALEALGVKATPALVVLSRSGKVKKVLGAKSLKARKIASALKSVAPNKKAPGK